MKQRALIILVAILGATCIVLGIFLLRGGKQPETADPTPEATATAIPTATPEAVSSASTDLNGIKRTLNLFLINHVFVGTKPLACNMKRKLLRGIGCPVGDGTTIVGPIECKGIIAIGKNCWIGKNCRINGNGTVEIGDNCDLGPEVTFQTGGHAIGNTNSVVRTYAKVGKRVRIGSNCTICNNATVSDGADIPDCTAVH